MITKEVIVTKVDTRVEGYVYVYEKINIYEDNVFLGSLGENRRLIHTEAAAEGWTLENIPYSQSSVVVHNNSRYISLVDNNLEEPGAVGTTNWQEIAKLTAVEKITKSMKNATAIITQNKLKSGEYTANEVTDLLSIYPKWNEGEHVEVGDVRMHNGTAYECIQAHNVLSTWAPDVTPALWTTVNLTGDPQEFVQPTGAHDSYQTGDRVLFEGSTYESTIDNNVWSPTDFPSGWMLIT